MPVSLESALAAIRTRMDPECRPRLQGLTGASK
ncbi:hypothetical protein AK812_SmicGene48175, partial [Symbiodinium microadriaticum]